MWIFWPFPERLQHRGSSGNAQKQDQPVYAWTINDADGMIGLIVLGIDGLITDDPALANKVIKQVQTLLPIERLLLRFRHLLDIFDEEMMESIQ